ncbi:MAG: hypothetical protein WAO95_19505 [Burkholderiales bacterium]
MKVVSKSDANASTRGKALSVEIDAARADLARLDALLADAVATLVESFGEVAARCAGQGELAVPLERAATALQFQDLASQLIAHIRDRLTGCAEAAPARNLRQPVRQHDLDEGSIELFQGDQP